MSTSLRISREDKVLRLTLGRLEKRNALDAGLCRALVEALENAAVDPGVHAVLLDAEGTVFCAGMDLEEALSGDAAQLAGLHERLFTIGARIRKPVVAAVEGPALGGGMALAANAHIVLAATEATFGLTEIRIGLWPFVVLRAVKLAVGERRAVELSLTGRIASAEEAREWGLVHQVVPAEELAHRAREVVAALSAWNPDVVSQGLEFTHRSRELSSEGAGRLADEYRRRAFESASFREAARAFLERNR
jgi:enoyl-CoA hydratase/carnithine racemase